MLGSTPTSVSYLVPSNKRFSSSVFQAGNVGSIPIGTTVAVVQLVELRIVIPRVAGSSPVGHLKKT